MTSPVRIALIGCGYIAQAEHIPALLLLPRAELRAVVDTNRNRASKIGQKLRVKHFVDMETCLDNVDVDAVDICTWMGTHSELVIEAAKRHKNILVEKPLSDNLLDARKAVRAAQRGNVILMVGYDRRYNTDCTKIRELIETGQLGKVRSAISMWKLSYPPRYIRLDNEGQVAQQLGHPLLNQSIHHFNLLRYWFGEVTEVRAAIVRENDYMVVLSFENGVLATHFWLGRMPAMGHGEEFRIFGSEGNVYTRLWSAHFPYQFAKTIVFRRKKQERAELLMPRSNSYVNEIRHFIECILDGKQPKSTGEDSVRDIELIEKIKEVSRI